MDKPLMIPANYIQTMLIQAEQRGVSRKSLMAGLEFDMAGLESNKPCTAIAYGQLHRRVTHTLGDDWFGLLRGIWRCLK